MYNHKPSGAPFPGGSARLLASAALVAAMLTPAGIAHAQEAAADSQPEIVVTAQKREEKLIDVPVSIAVLGGEELDQTNMSGVTEALRTVPGVMATATVQGGGSAIAIRGVAGANPVFGGPPPTAYYLDSVSLSLANTAVVPDAGLYDLSRVEVLRGPQGTLYGAGGLGGVVRVLTHDAELDRFEVKARASISSTDFSDGLNFRGDAAVNVPIVEDKVAARATISYQSQAGWIDRPIKEDANEREAWNARFKLRADTGEGLALGLTAWISRDDSNAPYSPNNRSIVRQRLEPITTDFDIFAGTIEYDFGSFAVKNTASYIRYKNESLIDTIIFGIPGVQRTFFDAKTFNDEMNITSTGDGNWKWSLGAFYRYSKELTLTHIPGVNQPSSDYAISKSGAIYGELTRLLLDGRIEITAGGRYFVDHQDAIGSTAPAPMVKYAEGEFKAFTPRFVITAHPSEKTTIYASYSEGFRSGYNQGREAAARGFQPVDPDKLRNYEVGLKGNWLEGRLGVEAAAYYVDWQGVQQILTLVSGNPPQFGPAGVNAKSASGPGFEVSATFRPTRGLSLTGAYSYNDITFDADVLSQGILLFAKGERMNFSTRETLSGSVNYDFPIDGNGMEGHFALSANKSTKIPVRRITGTNPPVVFLSDGDPLTNVSASIGISAPDDRWTLSAFIENLTRENGANFRNFLGQPDFDIYPRPRTVGVQLELKM